MEIPLTTQCDNCPWRIETNLDTIPNYEESSHYELQDSIAIGEIFEIAQHLRLMNCHKYADETPCVGWLFNQLGVGNNISLRLAVRGTDLGGKKLKVIGEQYETFEETLPENRRLIS